MLLILDSGHAENTSGKQSFDRSLREWEFNNDIQYKTKSRCEQHGIEVYLTNPNPATVSDIGLTTRANLGNDYWRSKGKPKALFVSLHANAYGSDWNSARGTETYVANNSSSTSKNFAKSLNDEIVKAMRAIDSGSKDRGVKTENFTVIYKASMPSVLVEYGFYTNKEDLKILQNNRDELVEATVKAVCNYFGVTYKAPTVSTPSNNDGTLWAVCVGAWADKSVADAKVKELKEKGYTSTYMIPR